MLSKERRLFTFYVLGQRSAPSQKARAPFARVHSSHLAVGSRAAQRMKSPVSSKISPARAATASSTLSSSSSGSEGGGKIITWPSSSSYEAELIYTTASGQSSFA